MLAAASPGACYLPFVGEADIAAQVNQGRPLYGADLEADRIAVAQKRFPEAKLVVANCDQFPFRGEAVNWAVADFDSYAYPYAGFRKFWLYARHLCASPFVLFFTDAQRQAISRGAPGFRLPGGKTAKLTPATRKDAYDRYFDSIVRPWFGAFIRPWRVVRVEQATAGMMLYWGAIVRRATEAEAGPPHFPSKGSHTRLKFDDTKKAAYLELIRAGRGRCAAARACGVVPETVFEHLARDPALLAAVSKAEMEATEGVENALYETALTGNVVAQQVWLYNRDPERWTDRRSVEHSGPGGGPVQVVTVVIQVDGQTMALGQWRQHLLEAAGGNAQSADLPNSNGDGKES